MATRRNLVAAVLAGALTVAGSACAGGDRQPVDLQEQAPATDPPAGNAADPAVPDPGDELDPGAPEAPQEGLADESEDG